MDVVRWVVAILRYRRQKMSEVRDCSEMEAVRPPVEMRTVCHRLEVADGGGEGAVVVAGGGKVVVLGDFSFVVVEGDGYR